MHELIFADGGSDDGIKTLADELGARLITAQPGRGSQLAAGVKASKADWIMIVHADTILGQNWPEVIAAHIQSSKRAGFGRLRFDSGGVMAIITAAWANFRARYLGLPYGDQMLILPRELYDRVGGYRALPLMEDVALARALRSQMIALDVIAQTSADRYIRKGWLLQGGRNLCLLILYFLGVAPDRLAQIYRR